MSSTEFNTWSRALHMRVHHGGLAAEALRERTLELTYVDRAREFDHIEWKLNNTDGLLTRPEYVALGLVVSLRIGYVDGAFPWKAFIINRLRGGVGVYGVSDAAVAENEGVITYHGRNRNAPGGKTSNPRRRTAPAPRKKPPKIYGPTSEFKKLEMLLEGDKERARYVSGSKTSDVVRVLADRHGFKGSYVEVEDTWDVIEGMVIPKNVTDGEFLLGLAQQHGFIFKIENGVLKWHSPRWRGAKFQVVEELIYGKSGDILKLDVDADFRLPMPERVTAQARDWLFRNTVVADYAATSPLGQVVLGVISHLYPQDRSQKDLLVRAESGLTVGSLGTATAKVAKRFQESHWNGFQINVDCVGNPKLLATRLVKIGGTGSALVDGLWYVAEARHVVSANDYQTQLKLKHPPKQVAQSYAATTINDANFDQRTGEIHFGNIYHIGFQENQQATARMKKSGR